ncbi:MAG: dienelactone hydrolase family protein [Chloroflexi bacterium]|nr:dienelactone hydrolase family protein [Chloroflexota bacterium]
MGDTITFPTNGRAGSGYLARASAASAPGVIVIQEWWGVNRHIKAVADRLAAAGYTALAPDLYHGVTTAEPDEAAKLLMALNIGEAAKDLHGAIAHLSALTGDRPVGTVGFCMGGALSLFAACENPDTVAACVDFYGGHPKVAYNLATLTAPVLGFFGELDTGVSPAVVDVLRQRLAEAGKEYTFTSYPDADHAFFNDDRPEVYDAAAADDAWRQMMAFYDQLLH